MADKYHERIEKKLSELSRANLILFSNPNLPSSCFRDWNQLLHLKLNSLGLNWVLLPVKEAIKALVELTNSTKDDVEEIKSIFSEVDNGVLLYILSCLPSTFRVENNSFSQLLERKDASTGASLCVYQAIKAKLSIRVHAEKQSLLAELYKQKSTTESISGYIGRVQNARSLLSENYEELINDSLIKGFLINGIQGIPAYQVTYFHLTHNTKDLSLQEVIAEMCSTGKEVELFHVSPTLSSPTSTPISSQIPSQPAEANAAFHPKQPSSVKYSSSSPPVRPCWNYVVRGFCRFDAKCSFSHSHFPYTVIMKTKCPHLASCQTEDCPFLHQRGAVSTSKETNSANNVYPFVCNNASSTSDGAASSTSDDAWGLTTSISDVTNDDTRASTSGAASSTSDDAWGLTASTSDADNEIQASTSDADKSNIVDIPSRHVVSGRVTSNNSPEDGNISFSNNEIAPVSPILTIDNISISHLSSNSPFSSVSESNRVTSNSHDENNPDNPCGQDFSSFSFRTI